MRAFEFVNNRLTIIQQIIECERGPWTILESTSNVEIWYSSLYLDSIRDKPQSVVDRLELFIQTKKENPTASFSNRDAPFNSKGPYGRLIPKLRHAHLNLDVSVVYKVEGSKPTILKIFGLWTHDELGTAGNPRVEKQMATKIKNADTH